MKITGTSQLTAEPVAVWRALNDPAVLVRAIPGCKRLEALGEDAFKMTIAAGVGSIKGVYDGQVRLTDQQEPGSFRMLAKGAGAPGTIGAEVLVTLADGPDGGTALTYDADATVGGMIGGVGQRMLVGVSKRMAAEFFGNVDAALSQRLVEPVETTSDGSELVSKSSTAPRASSTGSVFTAPGNGPAGGPGFAAGIVVGAGAALAGALIGAWISRRGRR